MPHPDPTRESYEAVPYERLVHRFTHPARIAAAARLAGVEPRPVPAARVLELGSASGDNLVGMAYGLPGASFVGVDLSTRQIEAGRRRVEALGLSNVTLVAGDLSGVDGTFGEFDYVVAHGVLSWVPEPVRRHLFRVCRERLATGGVAFVSWNALPGWRFRRLVRDVLLEGTSAGRDPLEKAQLARERLALVAAHVLEKESPWGRYLAERAAELSEESDADLLHDYLEVENEAFSLREVVGRARTAGLDYLCDAQEPFVLAEPLPPELALALGAIPDPVERETLLDTVRERTFRQGLFVREGEPRRPPGGVRDPARADVAALPAGTFPCAASVSTRPRASALARQQAAEGERVTSLAHRNVTLDPLAAEVLLLLDGSRTLAEVSEACCRPPALVGAVVGRLLADALLEA
ncbi:MAG: class I SAM-dependent methyltransferase [Thermoanaerobaculia bacterium]|nr:class I SAM-dependent methyltransferase [Thermoanaerobaculia bacterium]